MRTRTLTKGNAGAFDRSSIVKRNERSPYVSPQKARWQAKREQLLRKQDLMLTSGRRELHFAKLVNRLAQPSAHRAHALLPICFEGAAAEKMISQHHPRE